MYLVRKHAVHGPFGVVFQYRKPANISDQDIERSVPETHKMLKSLPGFRSVVYFNVNEEEYTVALSFYTQKAADNALEPIRKAVQARIPGAIVSKAEVATGEFVEELIAKNGNVDRNI